MKVAVPFIDADGTRIHYELSGAGSKPVLLLSNSLGTDLHMWDDQQAAFGESFRILRYDSRGHGRSAVPAGPYTMERLARDALCLLDALGLDRVHYCGLSMGGMVGMWLAVNAPHRLARVVLANTSAGTGVADPWLERAGLVRTQGMDAIRDLIIGRWFTAPFIRREPEAVARIAAMLTATHPEGYAACCEAIAGMDQRESIHAIDRPVLVIIGSLDPATPPEHGRLIHSRVAGAELVELDTAHLSNIEARGLFNRAVAGFLARPSGD